MQEIRFGGFFVLLNPMLDILIIGAGPAGLSCAVAAARAGLEHLVLDQGAIVDAIRRFPTSMTYFSTPEQLEIGDVPFVCSTVRPTRIDSLRYYQAVVRARGLKVETYAKVDRIARRGTEFVVTGIDGRSWEARAVVVATGYFDSPNPYSVVGVELPKVHRYYDEPYAYVGREVALVGGRNSVVDAALDLYRAGARVTIIHRGAGLSDGVKYWMLPDIQNRIKAGEIRALFNTTVSAIHPDALALSGEHAGSLRNDVVFVLIGFRPDNRILVSAGVRVDPETLAPEHDPATMTTNVPGLFVAGSIAAGRFNNRIFIENGRLHGALIVDSLAKT